MKSWFPINQCSFPLPTSRSHQPLKTLNSGFARYAFCMTKCFWSEGISPWNPQIHPSGAKNTQKCQSDVTMFHFDVTFSQKWCDIASLWCDILDTIFESDVTLLHFDVTFFQKWCDIASLWCDISADKLPCIFKTKEFFINLWTTKKPSRNWYASLKTWDISKYHLAFHCL